MVVLGLIIIVVSVLDIIADIGLNKIVVSGLEIIVDVWIDKIVGLDIIVEIELNIIVVTGVFIELNKELMIEIDIKFGIKVVWRFVDDKWVDIVEYFTLEIDEDL